MQSAIYSAVTASVASINDALDKLRDEVPLAPSSAPAQRSALSDSGGGHRVFNKHMYFSLSFLFSLHSFFLIF